MTRNTVRELLFYFILFLYQVCLHKVKSFPMVFIVLFFVHGKIDRMFVCLWFESAFVQVFFTD